MKVKTVTLSLVLIATAGCLGLASDEEDPHAAPNAEPTEENEPTPTTTQDTREPIRGLQEPPQWEPGDWWSIEIDAPLIGDPFTITRVVTGTENDNYLVGMPKDDWDERALILHVPGFGEVRQNDLSFEVHDIRFHPTQFPLTNDTTWTTHYETGNANEDESTPIEATVAPHEDGTADITFCCEVTIEATYDPELKALSSFNLNNGFVTYNVIDHGTDYEGIVTVPHQHDLIFIHGRAAGLLDLATFEPAPPIEEIHIQEDYYDRVSFMQIAGPLGVVDQPASSHYIERATAPDGTVFETTNPPTETEFTVTFQEHEAVGGTWTLEHIAPGPGMVFTEGIAYHVFDVSMPTGELLTGHDHHADHEDPE